MVAYNDYLYITMKNVIHMQVIKCHKELYEPLTKLLHARKWKNSWMQDRLDNKRNYLCRQRKLRSLVLKLTTSSGKRVPLAFLMASALYKQILKKHKFNHGFQIGRKGITIESTSERYIHVSTLTIPYHNAHIATLRVEAITKLTY